MAVIPYYTLPSSAAFADLAIMLRYTWPVGSWWSKLERQRSSWQETLTASPCENRAPRTGKSDSNVRIFLRSIPTAITVRRTPSFPDTFNKRLLFQGVPGLWWHFRAIPYTIGWTANITSAFQGVLNLQLTRTLKPDLSCLYASTSLPRGQALVLRTAMQHILPDRPHIHQVWLVRLPTHRLLKVILVWGKGKAPQSTGVHRVHHRLLLGRCWTRPGPHPLIYPAVQGHH